MLIMAIEPVAVAVNIRITAATVRPTLAALIPSNEARTPRYFLSSFQKRYTKNIKKVPGRKMATEETKLPNKKIF